VLILILLIHVSVSLKIGHQNPAVSCSSADLSIQKNKIIDSFKKSVQNVFKSKHSEKELISLLKAKIEKIKEKERYCLFLRSG
jgi:hypothetical protein